MNISLLLNSDSTSIEVIKYCALYFDKITIDKSIHIYTIEKLEKTKSKHKPIKCNLHFLQLYDLDLDKHIKMLENEGIVRSAYPSLHKMLDKEHRLINAAAKNIVGANIGQLFSPGVVSPIQFKKNRNFIYIEGKTEIISDEARESFNNIFSNKEINDLIKYKFDNFQNAPIEFYCLLCLYTGMFENFLYHISMGEHVVSNSGFVNNIVQSFYRHQSKNSKISDSLYNQIALNCLTIILPHIRNLSMEDILELRYQAKDELLELRNYIDTFMESLSADKILTLSNQEINSLIEQKIQPAINQFERKVKSIHLTALQNVMRNPTIYVPLIASIFSDLPQQIGLLSSLSLIAADTIIEYCKNKNELKNDALYFTIKLRK